MAQAPTRPRTGTRPAAQSTATTPAPAATPAPAPAPEAGTANGQAGAETPGDAQLKANEAATTGSTATTPQNATAKKEKTADEIKADKIARRQKRQVRKKRLIAMLKGVNVETMGGQLGTLDLGETDGYKNGIEIHLTEGEKGPVFAYAAVSSKGEEVQPLAISKSELMQAERRAYKLLDARLNPDTAPPVAAEGPATPDEAEGEGEDGEEGAEGAEGEEGEEGEAEEEEAPAAG